MWEGTCVFGSGGDKEWHWTASAQLVSLLPVMAANSFCCIVPALGTWPSQLQLVSNVTHSPTGPTALCVARICFKIQLLQEFYVDSVDDSGIGAVFLF